MQIDITCSSNEHIEIFINGDFAGEITINELTDYKDLKKEVERSRRLEALPRIVQSVVDKVFCLKGIADHVNQTEAKRQSAYTLGVVEGLNQKTNPKFKELIPRYDPSYELGYSHGKTLIQLLDCLKD